MIQFLRERRVAGHPVLCSDDVAMTLGIEMALAGRILRKVAGELGLASGKTTAHGVCVATVDAATDIPIGLLAEIRRAATELKLPGYVVERAKTLASKLVKGKLARRKGWIGYPWATLAFVALYLACRIEGKPVTPRVLAKALGLDAAPVSLVFKFMGPLGIRNAVAPKPSLLIEQEVVEKVLKGSAPFNAVYVVVPKAIEIAKAAEEMRIAVGRKPSAVAAAAVLLAAKEAGYEVPMYRVALAFGVSDVTLRRAVRLLERLRQQKPG